VTFAYRQLRVIWYMQIKLVQTVPVKDGYYLVRFADQGGLHLVLVQTELDGKRVIIPDTCPFKRVEDKKVLKCRDRAEQLYFSEFPTAWWSEEPIQTV
jgi:hypothetical protein